MPLRFWRENARARSAVLWALAASAALLVLGLILMVQRRRTAQRWETFLSESPVAGSRLFRSKGCVDCHAVNGVGSAAAPDLGKKRSDQPDLPQLVAAMWNHAPRMWQRMTENQIRKPPLDEREMAAIFSYLYMAQHVEAPGDSKRGGRLFETEGCVQCHALSGTNAKSGAALAASSETPSSVLWIEALWNHTPQMQAQIQKAGLSWPEFQEHDLNDLYSYVSGTGPTGPTAMPEAPPDPERGWKLFQVKRCIACHSIKNDDGRAGPPLGPIHSLPPTFTQLGQLMVSKAPQMLRTMAEQGIARPSLQGQEMTDLFAFLFSLRYVEPTGSAHVGKSLFTWRGCYRCHGVEAEGTSHGPALRGRAHQYTAMALAAALWHHGPDMNRRSQQMSIAWPTLLDTDVGDLLTFLSSPLEQSRASR